MYVHCNQWLIGVVAPTGTGGNVAAVAGGVVGSIMVVLLVILLIILLVVLRKRKGELTNSLVQKLISCFSQGL